MSFEYLIIRATEIDAEEILRLQQAAYLSEAVIYRNFTIQPLTQTLEETLAEFRESTVLKAVSDGQIIGSVRATAQKDGSVYIGKLMVLPDYQNRGVGKRLMRAVEGEFAQKRYWLVTGHKSEKNLRIYEKLGYSRYKTEKTTEGLSLIYLQKQEIIRIIAENKKEFLPLLLIGDEDEGAVDSYLYRGDLFALFSGEVKSVCVVTDEGSGVLEIQNLATDRRYQSQGYGTKLIEYVAEYYSGRYDKIVLGTGDVPSILAFYEHRRFTVTHRIPDYFTTHYDHPIIEEGVLLKDKVYLERKMI